LVASTLLKAEDRSRVTDEGAHGLTATYPDPKAPYDSSVDPAWLARLPGDLHWDALGELDKLILLGRLAGSCPRCGHGINHDIPKLTQTPGGGKAESVSTQDADESRGPVDFVCNCLSSHEKDKTGCGTGFTLPSEMLVTLPGHS
jgi:hypothetical protein